MVDPQLSRREILSGMAVAGGAGALVGSGSVSLFTDEETFANNTLTASSSVAGTVDIDVAVGTADNKVIFEIELPDLTVENETSDLNTKNNPAQIWVRTGSCPESTLDAADLDVKVYLEDCESEPIAEGSVFDVFATGDGLRTGELLACTDGDDCLNPGSSRTLVVETTNVPSGIDPVELDLEVFADQCRYSSDPENPFDPSHAIAEKECRPPEGGGKAISFISFCVDGSDASEPDPDITDVNFVDDAVDPTSVEWETAVPVDYVVAKSGQKFTMYDYSGSNTKSGTVKTGGDQNADFFGEIDSVNCPSGGSNKPEACPCQAAVEEFANGDFTGESVKLEDDKGDLNP